MTSVRFLFGLIQALVALLLVAAAPADAAVRVEHPAAVELVGRHFKPFGIQLDGTSVAIYEAERDRLDDDDRPDSFGTSAEGSDFAAAWASFVRLASRCYRNVPLSHRYCAAPPTGPPTV